MTFAGSYDVDADSAEEAERDVLPLIEADPSALCPVAYPAVLDEPPHFEIATEALPFGDDPE